MADQTIETQSVKIEADVSKLDDGITKTREYIEKLNNKSKEAKATMNEAFASPVAEINKQATSLKKIINQEDILINRFDRESVKITTLGNSISSAADKYNKQTAASTNAKNAFETLSATMEHAKDVMNLVPKGYKGLDDYREHLIKLKDEYQSTVEQVQKFKQLRGESTDINPTNGAAQSYNIYKNGNPVLINNVQAVEAKNNLEMINKKIDELDKAWAKVGDDNNKYLSRSGMVILGRQITAAATATDSYATKALNTKIKIQELTDEQNRQKDALAATKDALDGNTQRMDTSTASISKAQAASSQAASGFAVLAGEAGAAGAVIAAVVGKVGDVINKIIHFVGKITSEIKGAVKVVKSGIDSVTGGLLTSQSQMLTINGFFKSINKTINDISSMAARMIKRKLLFSLFDGMKHGVDNVAKESDRVNRVISNLIGSLKTFANQMGAAFSPVLNAVLPVLTKITDAATAVMDKFAQLTASISGSDTYIKAIPVSYDYAKSLESQSKSTDKARKSQEKLNATILAFDEINKMNSADSSSSDTTSNTDGTDATKNFTIEKITSPIKNLADKVKKAIKSGNWQDVANTLSGEINGLLDYAKKNITQQSVGKDISKWITGVMTGFMSLMRGIHWEDAGTVIGNGLNIAINSILLFLNNLDMHEIGNEIGRLFTSAVGTVNWRGLGDIIGKGFMQSWNFFLGFIEKLDPVNLANDFTNLFVGIAESIKPETIGTTIGMTIEKFALFIKNALGDKSKWETIGQGIVDLINSIFSEIKGEDCAEAINAVTEGIITSAQKILTDEKLRNNVSTFFKSFLKTIDFKSIFILSIPFIVNAIIGSNIGAAIATAMLAGLVTKLSFGLTHLNLMPGLGTVTKSANGAIGNDGKISYGKFATNLVTNTVTDKQAALKKKFGFASGGYPTNGQMFIANEEGPELVGNIGNKTAVANNEQIVAAVASGVKDAVASVMSAFYSNSKKSDYEQAQDIVLNIDGEEMARVTYKGMQKINKRTSTTVQVA